MDLSRLLQSTLKLCFLSSFSFTRNNFHNMVLNSAEEDGKIKNRHLFSVLETISWEIRGLNHDFIYELSFVSTSWQWYWFFLFLFSFCRSSLLLMVYGRLILCVPLSTTMDSKITFSLFHEMQEMMKIWLANK